MGQIIIEDGQSGFYVRTVALNPMFTELYAGLQPPILLPNQNANIAVFIPANTWVSQIFMRPNPGNPTINIGLTPDGGEILTNMAVTYPMPIQVQQYFIASGYLYFTFVFAGAINIRIDLISNYD